MTLVVGLGNIGKGYEATRHNVGFMLIDLLLQELETTNISSSKFKGELYKNGSSLFLKPHTYMNLSGHSVCAVKNFYNCDRLIVIHDDIDLSLGTVRFKKGGSAGGHNGLKSIDELCSNDYERIRIGIGKDENVKDFVLSKFSRVELEKLDEILKHCKSALLELLSGASISEISSRYSLRA